MKEDALQKVEKLLLSPTRELNSHSFKNAVNIIETKTGKTRKTRSSTQNEIDIAKIQTSSMKTLSERNHNVKVDSKTSPGKVVNKNHIKKNKTTEETNRVIRTEKNEAVQPVLRSCDIIQNGKSTNKVLTVKLSDKDIIDTSDNDFAGATMLAKISSEVKSNDHADGGKFNKKQ